MRAYDRSYDPPAPVAEVSVGHPLTGVTTGVAPGKLDTGAALTVVPQWMVVQLGLAPRGEVWARGYDGPYSQRGFYFVRLVLDGHELAAVQCLAAERDTVLVGRNVLNRFLLTLDGRNLRFDLQPARG
jgi:hypothetical protein